MHDDYPNFRQLEESNQVGRDFAVIWNDRNSPVVVMAIHGGGIEPGTDRIAREVAGKNYSFYAFMGLRVRDNRCLHIPSNHFDEPFAVRLVQKALIAVSIHGSRDSRPVLFIGGRHQQLKQTLLEGFKGSPIQADMYPKSSLSGQDRWNICNRCQTGRGVQLELSAGLRNRIFSPLADDSAWETTPLFDLFVSVVRQSLALFDGSAPV